MLLNRQNNDKFDAAAPELEGCDDDDGGDGTASSWRSLEMAEGGVTEGDQGFRVTTGRRVE